MTAAPARVTRRERARAATIDEIKHTALDLMREQRTTDVRFTDIARVMGMTPPALYRYFADRDELLTVLIADAYGQLGAGIAAAREARAGRGHRRPLAGRRLGLPRVGPQRAAAVRADPRACRCPATWRPTRGRPRGRQRAMAELAGLFVAAAQAGRLRAADTRGVAPRSAACAQDKHAELEGVLPPETFQAMLHAWASLHGFTSLEAYGHFDWLEPRARDELFVSQVQMIAKVAGLPVPS